MKSQPEPKKLVREQRLPSGIKVAWRIWRYCCCRNGFYPLIVAPFITASFFLDVFCTAGCGFVKLDVGFEPMNDAWDRQTIEFGLFNYQSGVGGAHQTSYMNTLHPGCIGYADLFKEYFLEGDKTWIMAQIMGIVSGCAGCIATIMVWLMVVSPIPVCFLWPGVILPASLVAFLGSGAKFLFFDIEICRSKLWLPEGDDVEAEVAESCSFGMDAILSIISTTLSLACVLLVCLKAPKRRELENSRGLQYDDLDEDIKNLRTHSMEDSVDDSASYNIDIEAQSSKSYCKRGAYDLDEISKTSKNTPSQYSNNDVHSTMALSRKPSSDTASMKSSSKKALKNNRKIDLESERLRQADPSVEYNEKEFHKMFSEKPRMIPRPLTPPPNKMTTKTMTPPLNKMSAKKNDQQSTSPFASFSNAANKLRNKSNLFSPAAPSDESSFMLRSPMLNMTGGKENTTPNYTPKKKMGSSKKKSSRKTDQTSNKTQKYDEDLIQKCVLDLERSFSESEQMSGQEY